MLLGQFKIDEKMQGWVNSLIDSAIDEAEHHVKDKIVEMLENLLKTREWYAKVDREYMKEAIQKIKEMP